MGEADPPRTRLEQLLRQRHLTTDDMRRRYAEASGIELSERQAYRWVAGELRSLPHPHACRTLERIFGEPVARLLGPPYGTGLTPSAGLRPSAPGRGGDRHDWQGQVLALSANRARDFLARTEVTNVGTETLDQLGDDIRRLVIAAQLEPLPGLLADMADAQRRAFELLDGRQRPEQTRDLYLLAGVSSGLMAKASHDLGAPHDALTQARAAYTAADNAGHDGLCAWTRGLQALISYWSGRLAESVSYARRGADAAQRSRGTSGVWLAASEARALAAQGDTAAAHTAVQRAADARDVAAGDELDELGGLCTFTRPRELYYAADALAWAGAAEADHTAALATEALDGYAIAPEDDRAYGDQAGARCALARARLARGQIDGAAEALAPVLELPCEQRIHGIVTSVEQVRRAVAALPSAGRDGAELADQLHVHATERLALTR